MTRRLLPLALALLATACGDDGDKPGDDTGTDTADEDCWPYCEETSTSIAPTDDTAIGVTGAAVIDPLPQSAEADIVWTSAAESALSWGVVVGSETLRFVEAEAVYPTCEGDMPSIGVDCPDFVAVEGTLSLTSADGMLDAAVPLTFSIDEYTAAEGTVSFGAALEEADLGSGFVLADHVDTGAYDEVSLSLSGRVSSAGALSLTLQAQGTGSDGNVAWAEMVDIATVGGGAY